MKKANKFRGLGLYSPPEKFDVAPEGENMNYKGRGEGNYESETPANIDAATYGEMKKRTKRQGRGTLGIYS